ARWRRETDKPRAATLCGEAGAGSVWVVGTACLPAAGAGTRDTTLCRGGQEQGRCADPSDHCPGHEVWPLRLPADHLVAAKCGMAGGQGSRAADLATGGAESTAKTKTPSAAVAERWFLCSTAASAPESCLELRFRQCGYA